MTYNQYRMAVAVISLSFSEGGQHDIEVSNGRTPLTEINSESSGKPFSTGDVASMIGTNTQTARNWLKRFKEIGLVEQVESEGHKNWRVCKIPPERQIEMIDDLDDLGTGQ